MTSDAPLDVLIFAPHPDDAEIAMGGTIAKLIDHGKRVGVIDLTRGERGSKGNADIRAREAKKASEILGLHHRGQLDLGDGRIADVEENRLKVASEIRRFRAPLLFVCPDFDPHPDHQAVARLVHAAYFLARLPKVELDHPAFSPQQCLNYFIHDMRQMTFAIDISDYMETKLNAMKAYRSQFIDVSLPEGYRHVGTSDYLTQVEAYNRTIGVKIGAVYAEGYFSNSPIPVSLPTDLMS